MLCNKVMKRLCVLNSDLNLKMCLMKKRLKRMSMSDIFEISEKWWVGEWETMGHPPEVVGWMRDNGSSKSGGVNGMGHQNELLTSFVFIFSDRWWLHHSAGLHNFSYRLCDIPTSEARRGYVRTRRTEKAVSVRLQEGKRPGVLCVKIVIRIVHQNWVKRPKWLHEVEWRSGIHCMKGLEGSVLL